MSDEADEIWAILKGISETNKELSKAHQEFKEEQKALQVAQQKTDEQCIPPVVRVNTNREAAC
jgi:hypothetical protein